MQHAGPPTFNRQYTATPRSTGAGWRARHIVRDSLAALAAFGLLAAIIGWQSLPEYPMSVSQMAAASTPANRTGFVTPNIDRGAAAVLLPIHSFDARRLLQTDDRTVTVVVLASIFAAIIAFNLWFLRHLGRVYASTRPDGGRGG